MRGKKAITALAAVAVAGTTAVTALGTAGAADTPGGPQFSNPRQIDNPYLPITTRTRCEHRGKDHDGTRTRSVQTVLRRTKRFTVNGQRVDAVIVRDKAYANGRLVEIAFDYFAQSDDGTVYYLGEHVNNYENGKLKNHKGTWLLGKHTDVPGVAMPANPKTGDQFRFEDVPGVTAESNRVEETGMRGKAAGRIHRNVIRIQEFIQPEGEVEYKLYAPGVGKITEYPPDGRAELKRCR